MNVIIQRHELYIIARINLAKQRSQKLKHKIKFMILTHFMLFSSLGDVDNCIMK